jgi:hypothetical protein
MGRSPDDVSTVGTPGLLASPQRGWGSGFCPWLRENIGSVGPVIRSAKQRSVVPGNGSFDAPEWFAPGSPAMSPSASYEQIGAWLRTVGDGYRAEHVARHAGTSISRTPGADGRRLR